MCNIIEGEGSKIDFISHDMSTLILIPIEMPVWAVMFKRFGQVEHFSQKCILTTDYLTNNICNFET